MPAERQTTAPHDLVGMQAALHDGGDLAGAHHFDGTGGGGVAVRRIDDGEAGNVDAGVLGDAADFSRGPHQDGLDDPR